MIGQIYRIKFVNHAALAHVRRPELREVIAVAVRRHGHTVLFRVLGSFVGGDAVALASSEIAHGRV